MTGYSLKKTLYLFRRRIITGLAVATVATAALLCLRPWIHEEKQEKALESTHNLSFEQRLLILEASLNKNAPRMMDTATRFDGAKASGRSFTYFYTLVNDTAPSIDTRILLEQTEHDRLRMKVLNDPEFDELREASATIIFNYKDKNGVPYVQVKITPDDYNGNPKPEKVNPHFE